MKVVNIKEIEGSERHIKCPKGGFESLRFILEKDGMGFSLHKTLIPKGESQHWHYKNHLEACFCISGKGLLTNIETYKQYEINPDDCYVLDNNDNHAFQALEDVVLISVFNPPVKGNEVHKEDGSYE